MYLRWYSQPPSCGNIAIKKQKYASEIFKFGASNFSLVLISSSSGPVYAAAQHVQGCAGEGRDRGLIYSIQHPTGFTLILLDSP